jgi:signal transduction histidine kinase
LNPKLQRSLAYAAVVGVCFVAGTLAGWTALAVRIDHYAYDLMTRMTSLPPADSQAVVVAIDEETLRQRGGMRRIRPILAETLSQLAAVRPNTVALDVILSDPGDPAEDARLEVAMRDVPNLILPCELVGDGVWEDPLDRFRTAAVALGHVHPEEDRSDGVSRELSLEETGRARPAEPSSGSTNNPQSVRRWALALEAFRISHRQEIVESPDDLQIGGTTIPAPRALAGRPMLIRYAAEGIPLVSALSIAQNASLLRGKTVFLGVTALSAARDRMVNPYGQNVPGVAVHAHAYETMARARFLEHASDLTVLGLSLFFAISAGLAFALLSGWMSYAVAVVILLLAHAAPIFFFSRQLVLPYFGPAAVAWLSSAGAATYQYFFVRRQLSRSESEKSRYQQAIHWAAHEMRTPLTAIQGSSEIMTRYALPAEKSKQLSEMINSESKRLARLIQTFLDVERLADGHMELKREHFAAADVVETCLGRVRPLAERKQITITLGTEIPGELTGDRELMEYAFYNLLTNAIKYSPPDTHVTVGAEPGRSGELRLYVRDQGIGMDSKELKSIFQKFYRTRRAEASGEVGTGIGLSIVEQIVTHHGGRMEVTSEPGKGSCFTMVLRSEFRTTSNAEVVDRRG